MGEALNGGGEGNARMAMRGWQCVDGRRGHDEEVASSKKIQI